MYLRTTDPPERVRGTYTLGLYRHHSNPQWWFILRGTHRVEETICWILAKHILGWRIAKKDSLLLDYLVADRDRTVALKKRVRHLSPDLFGTTVHPDLYLENRASEHLLAFSKRVVRSFDPQVFPYRHWSPQRLPPKRYIGIGYRDHGSLSTAPAWQDQLVFSDEDTYPELFGILGTLESLLPPALPTQEGSGAEESKVRTKRKDNQSWIDQLKEVQNVLIPGPDRKGLRQ